MILILSLVAMAAWLALIALPWQPSQTRERLEAAPLPGDVGDVTVLIPARDEAAGIERTLRALSRQGPGLEVIVVDDASKDGTAEICERVGASLAESHEPCQVGIGPSHGEAREFPVLVSVVSGTALPPGWVGKLWALQHGLARVQRPYTLLLDADIELDPNVVPVLRDISARKNAQLVSVMAELHCRSAWEKLLVPSFVFFFKLLYPFALVAKAHSRVAAAAGGCTLISTSALKAVGGFEPIRGELIDDCSLAALLKRRGYSLWLGLSRAVRSSRRYDALGDFWTMVSRTAFTQLRYSGGLLAITTVAMAVVFVAPLAGLIGLGGAAAGLVAAAALLCMCLAYAPVVRFYRLPPAWTLSLPVAAMLYLAMTWSSAINYWRGVRAEWKDRTYDAKTNC